MANTHTIEELHSRQALPLSMKVKMSETRIREWINYHGQDGVYISFSGGKDSTVLVDLVDKCSPNNNIPLVFCDTGLEYPEIREFVKSYGDRVVWLKPKMQFKKVIETYGYPFISKDVSQAVNDVMIQARNNNCKPRETNLWNRWFNPESDYCKKYPQFSRARYDFLFDAPDGITFSHRCCNTMKKDPAHTYSKETGRVAITGQMASESRLRTQKWLQNGCNAFDTKNPVSNPMSFWTDQDVLLYIKLNNLPICSVYGEIVEDNDKSLEGQMTLTDFAGECGLFDIGNPLLKTTGCDRTGCMYCGFGCNLRSKDDDRFIRMKTTHPKQYEWIMKPWKDGGLGYKKIIDWLNENGLSIKY